MGSPAAVAPTGAESARDAGLRYVSDATPGLSRHRAGRGFAYRDSRGRLVRNRRVTGPHPRAGHSTGVARCLDLPEPRGHLQATGRDARGRKQYRYHPMWTASRDETKYGRMEAFGRALPALRRQVARDIGQPALCRETRAGHGRDVAREDADSRRQRRVRSRQRILRPDDTGKPPRARATAHACTSSSARKAGSVKSWNWKTPPWRAASSDARTCPARCCSSTSTRTARARAWARPTSTRTCGPRRAGLHGQGLPHVGRHRAGGLRARPARARLVGRRRASDRSPKSWPASLRDWATHPRCAGAATFTLASSTPTWRARSWIAPLRGCESRG